MPIPAYMTIEGSKQGPITQGTFTADSVGNIWQEGHEDEILVQEFSHYIEIPRDPQSGQPAGQRVHHPLMITKVFDKSSPLLYQALTSGEVLTKCEIKWYRTSSTGGMEHYFTTKLTNALIVDIKAYMPHCQDPAMKTFTHLERVSFSYLKIEWEHTKASTTGSDDWRSPHAA